MTSIRAMTAKDWWVFLTSPHGRIGRYDYNVKFLLSIFAITLVAWLVDYAIMGDAVFQKDAKLIVSQVTQLVCTWPFLAVTTKRLHDMNYRGWWIIAFYFVPMILGVAGIVYGMFVQSFLILVAVGFFVFAALISFLIVVSCIKGQVGPNRFGPDPLDEKNIVIEGSAL